MHGEEILKAHFGADAVDEFTPVGPKQNQYWNLEKIANKVGMIIS